MAATILNLESGEAVRIAALDEGRELADARYLEIPDRRERQMRTYREASEGDLFKIERVYVNYSEMESARSSALTRSLREVPRGGQ